MRVFLKTEMEPKEKQGRVADFYQYTVKKIRRFYGKIPGNQLPVHIPLFLPTVPENTFVGW